MKKTPDDTTALDPANEPPPLRRKTQTTVSTPPQPVPARGHSALAPSFTPPITRSKAMAKLPPDSSSPETPGPASVLPLREVAGVDGLVRFHVPFSLNELSQIESRLGSYTSNPSAFIKEFQYITQSYSLTFHDVHMILTNNLLPEERRRVWEQAKTHADEIHQTDTTYPIGSEAVPDQDPRWDYNSTSGILARDRFITCLLAGLRRAALKPVNFEKLQEVFQDRQENPSQFLERLTKALLQYTNLDPENPEGKQLLMTYFFSQSYPDIRDKLKRLERGPLTPQAEVLALAFKVYHGRDEKARKQKYHMLAQAVRPTTATNSQPPRAKGPPAPCYKCGQKGHWAKACPSPRKPKGPCPRCHREGHWAVDCPYVAQDRGASHPNNSPADLLGLAMDD